MLDRQSDALANSGPPLMLDEPARLPAASPVQTEWRQHAIAVLILLVGMLLAHGWSLSDGLFGDDHLHITRYSSRDYSWPALLQGAVIQPEKFLEAWWQEKPTEWRYLRPFMVLLGKAVYHSSGGSVKALHALSLLLHLTTAIMVYALVVLMTGRKFWAVVAGLLFVVYSHSVYAVSWLAAQNAVLQTCLTLGALLAYMRASRLNLDAGRPRGFDPAPERIRPGLLALSILLWVLAMFSREAAVVFPVFAAGADLAFGGWRQVRARWGSYLAIAVVGGLFAAWRLTLYLPIPPWYYRYPDGPGYVFWWIAKLMHYITSAIWLSPMMVGPSGRYDPWREVPGDCLLMIAIIGIMSTGYYLACRRARGYWLWPLWVLMTFLPVVPIMAGFHAGYMAGVGFAIAMVLGPALRDRIQPVSIGKWSRPVAIWFLIATCTYIPIYRPMWLSALAAEKLTMKGVTDMPPRAGARDVFFINLPFINIYAQLTLWEELGGKVAEQAGMAPVQVDPVKNPYYRAHVLTYAPDMLRMDRPCRLEQVDSHSFKLSIEGRPYFSGALGQFLIQSMRRGGRMHTGETIRGGLCDVQILRADEDGVREMLFRFRESLTSPRYCFYVCTNQCGAARVNFSKDGKPDVAPATQPAPTLAQVEQAAARLESGQAGPADLLFTAAASEDTKVALAARAALQRVVPVVAEKLAAPVQAELARPGPAPSEWARIREWWRAYVDDEALAALWVHRDDAEQLRQTRERLYHIRQIASRVIQTDLYLTGPPFPSPR